MVSPIDSQKALSGMDYPAGREDIVTHAEQHGADEQVLDAQGKIEDRQYDGPSGVSSAVFG